MKRRPASWIARGRVVAAALPLPAAAAEPTFPVASQIGHGAAARAERRARPSRASRTPTTASSSGWSRCPATPSREIEKTMTNDALRKQGMTVEKRESLTLRERQGR